VAEDLFAEDTAARKNLENIKIAIRKYDYLLNAHGNSDRVPFWLYMSAKFLLALDYDHLAYHRAQKILALSDSSPCTTGWRTAGDIPGYKHEARLIVFRVLARNNLSEEFKIQAAGFKPVKSNDYAQLAQCYALLGDNVEAVHMLEKSLEQGNIEWRYLRSSYTAGAVAMVYALGEFEKVEEFSHWMIEEGRDSKNYIPPDDRGYFKNQWQSSYDIVSSFRKLAEKGSLPDFKKLKDGEYKKSVRGFVDMIDLTLEVENGKITTISASNRKDDRPLSAPEVIPGRIMNRETTAVDAITSATITSTAILAAAAEALAEAQ
jgi:uncharacterized protein with FMN-binding domain